MENRPLETPKQHVLAAPGETGMYQIELDEEFLQRSIDGVEESGIWIASINWKHPDDVIPLNLKPINVASSAFFTDTIPAIHRVFAQIELGRTHILEFCTRTGFLGQNTSLLELDDGKLMWGEALGEWIAEINKMRVILKLHDLLVNGTDKEAMSHFIDLSESYASVNRDRGSGYKAPSGALDEEFDLRYIEPELDKEGVVLRATRTVFHGLIRRAIRHTCYPDFELVKGADIQLHPKSLLGAIYLSLLDEVLMESEPDRKCVVCGNYFALLHGRMQYCSSACRQKAHRLRSRKQSNGS